MFKLVLTALALCATASAENRLATFTADVTIPIGHACMGGGVEPAREIITPLLARGVVLLPNEGAPIVWCAVDWCEIRNDAYDHWRDELAAAANTQREHVIVSSVHQHDAPVVDYRAQELLDDVGLPNALCDVAFAKQALERVVEAMKSAIVTAQPVTHYGTAAAQVKEIASNRRVMSEDQSAIYHRGSATRDPRLRAQPEGEIDPMLRALVFFREQEPIAMLSAYATHPMSFYGQGGVNYDFPGIARESMQQESGCFQVYFSGCSGDVTAGKFNDGAPENREVLAMRLLETMKQALSETHRFPLENVQVRVERMRLEPKSGPNFDRTEQENTLQDAGAKTFQRNLAAMGLSWRERVEKNVPIDVVAVNFGEAIFLLLPAESFVGYQLAAVNLLPGKHLVVAGYGECAPGYIPTELGTAEGFQQESWCWVAPGSHEPMLNAIGAVLGVK